MSGGHAAAPLAHEDLRLRVAVPNIRYPRQAPPNPEPDLERRSIESIIEALGRASVRCLIVGGVAVVAHGHVRFTTGLDLVLDPDCAALQRAIDGLAALGYRPRAPVPFEQFADPAHRRRWSEEKGMTVFSLSSPEHPATELELFLEPPFDFDLVHARAANFELAPGRRLTFVNRNDLLDMKRAAGRPQDLLDVEALESIHGEEERGDDRS